MDSKPIALRYSSSLSTSFPTIQHTIPSLIQQTTHSPISVPNQPTAPHSTSTPSMLIPILYSSTNLPIPTITSPNRESISNWTRDRPSNHAYSIYQPTYTCQQTHSLSNPRPIEFALTHRSPSSHSSPTTPNPISPSSLAQSNPRAASIATPSFLSTTRKHCAQHTSINHQSLPSLQPIHSNTPPTLAGRSLPLPFILAPPTQPPPSLHASNSTRSIALHVPHLPPLQTPHRPHSLLSQAPPLLQQHPSSQPL